jgi:chromosome partitioning protein
VIIAVISRKGGVGKTTTAVNLSAALARRGQRVLLVDLDSQASASLSLGVDRAALAPSSADVLLGGLAASQAVRQTAIDGLHLITASIDLMHADSDLALLRNREGRLRAVLASPLAGSYDFILFDCPSSLGLLQVNAVVAADTFLVPVVPQFLAAAGVQNLIAAAQRAAWDAAVRTRPLGVLLTMVDYRTRATRDTVDQIRAELGSLVFAIEIRINTRLAEAPRCGQSIFEFDPAATGAAAYQLLAEELLLRTSDAHRASTAATPGGLAAPPGPPPAPPDPTAAPPEPPALKAP